MIKVLRIINRFNLGGPTYNATYLSAFLPDDFETLLCGGAHEPQEGDSLFIAEGYGLKPHIIGSMRRSLSYSNDRKALKELRTIIREFKPDIVHTHASKAGALGRLAARKENVPVVIHTFHGHVFHSYFGRLKTWLYKTAERRLAKHTDAIIAISDIQKNELSEIHKIAPGNKFHVIPLGFDLNRFQHDHAAKRAVFRAKYQLSDDVISIGIIGRLTAIKNHDLFFDALKIVCKSTTKQVKAFVIGDGELREELESKAKQVEEELGKCVFVFTSWIKNIAEALPGLEVVCLTSFNEGTPVSLIEAQAANVPVISTNVGGVADVVNQGETGYIIDGFEPLKYAEKLGLLVNNEEIRQKMSQNGWFYVKDKFHYTRLCSDVEKLYRQILEKKGNPRMN